MKTTNNRLCKCGHTKGDHFLDSLGCMVLREGSTDFMGFHADDCIAFIQADELGDLISEMREDEEV